MNIKYDIKFYKITRKSKKSDTYVSQHISQKNEQKSRVWTTPVTLQSFIQEDYLNA